MGLLTQAPLYGEVSLSGIFQSGMVLQREMPVPVWGRAGVGEKISVTCGESRAETLADESGRWMVKLPAMKAGGPVSLVAKGTNTVTLTNILIGEVWLCSGQSNMVFTLDRANDAAAEIAKADYPQIRFFSVVNKVADRPQTENNGQWVTCSPIAAPKLTAVGYFFAQKLQKDLGVPVGIINASWGSSLIEAWIPRETLANDPDFQPILERFAKQTADYPAAKASYEKDLPDLTKKWEEAAGKAKAAGKAVPSRPVAPVLPIPQFTPAGIYNAEIAPLAPFALRGFVWYQGEQNVLRAEQYGKLLPTLIGDWRKIWGQGDVPFLIVQLPNVEAPMEKPTLSYWAELREVQAKAARQPSTGLIVTIDLGEKDVHPKNKKDVGYRTALTAEKLVYGKNVEASGPVFQDVRADGDAMRVKFAFADGLKTKDGGPVRGFSVAGENKIFFWATEAMISGDEITVQCKEVLKPVAIRYNWANNPSGNLYNNANLPAAPFRTDDWPGMSAGKK